jgi:hypothetical protein
LVEGGVPPGRGKALRFTRDGSRELEAHLARTCDQVREGVQRIIPPRKLDALMLAGGYGRGEGGVLKTETGDQPYNDLEFYVCARGNRFFNDWRYTRALHHLAAELAPSAGVEIEFKVISLAELRRRPITMFYYDLVMGHRWLWGDEELLQHCEHHREAGELPLSEATRLLMNRCSGLLFAKEKLERQPLIAEDADFVGRNVAKARLAFGDAVLACFGQYHWSCLERHERLLRLTAPLPWLSQVRSLHAAGVDFKLHPRRARASVTVLQSELEELRALGLSLWLWLESRRLGSSFQSARDYAMSSIRKCPGTNPWRNYLVNVKAFGPLAFCDRRSFRCPKERVLSALTILLWEPWRSDVQPMRHLRHELRMRAEDQDIPGAYRSLWARFN